MKVIVAGLPKTGTKTMTAALKKLGYEVYDVLEHTYYLEKEWAKIFERGARREDFQRMYKGIDAVVDVPASCFWEEIRHAFPSAKIILTLRRSEEVWLESVQNHYHVCDKLTLWKIVEILEPCMRRNMLSLIVKSCETCLGIKRYWYSTKTRLNETILRMKYRAHNAHVIQNTPRDQLLIYNCEEGWGPLCKFLDKSIPDESFPHENKRGSLGKESVIHPASIKYQKELAASFLKLLILFIAFLYVSYWILSCLLTC